MWTDRFAVFDVETTGLDPLHDRVIEYAAVLFEDGKAVSHVEGVVRLNVDLPENIIKLTGITQADLDAGRDPAAVLREIVVSLYDTEVIVAHNADFDRKFLLSESSRQVNNDAGWLALEGPWVCSCDLARAITRSGLCDSGYNLTSLCSRLGVEVEGGLHRAANDAETTGRVVLAMAEKMPDFFASRADTIARVAAWRATAPKYR